MTRNESGRDRREEPGPSEGAPLGGEGSQRERLPVAARGSDKGAGVGVCVLSPWGTHREIETTPTPDGHRFLGSWQDTQLGGDTRFSSQ